MADGGAPILALYRRYRPDTFEQVVGQDHAVGPIMAALGKGRINHAYLFSGPRGCGKTTSARVLARSLNCIQGPTPTPCGVCPSCLDLANGSTGSLDVIEIDAASHRGIDDARDLRERVANFPVRDRYKVVIIDEAHQITTDAFSALLKVVEEPPEHVVFVFATTEPEKVLGTIRSRTHHFPFRLVPPARLLQHLEDICRREGVTVEPAALSLVIRAGGGSVRDSMSVLDQLMAGADGDVDVHLATSLLGYVPESLLDDLVDALAAVDGAAAFASVHHAVEAGHDPRRYTNDLLERLRTLVVVSRVGEGAAAVLPEVPEDAFDRLRHQASRFGHAELSRAADVVAAALGEMAGATSPRLLLELLVARLLVVGADRDGGVATRVERLERQLAVLGEGGALPRAGAGRGEPSAGGNAAAQDRSAQERGAPNRGAPDRAVQDRGAPDRPGPQRSQEPSTGGGDARRPAPASPTGPGRATTSTGTPATADDAGPSGDARPAGDARPSGDGRPAGAGDAGPSGPSGDGASSGAAGLPAATPTPAPASDGWPAIQAPGRRGPAAPGGTGRDRPDRSAPGGPGALGGGQGGAGQGGAGQGGAGQDSAGQDGAAVPPAPERSAAAAGAGPASEDAAEPRDGGAPGGPGQPETGTGVTVEVVRRTWDQVVDRLRTIRRLTWTLVSENAQVLALDQRGLTLGFPTQGLADAFNQRGHSDCVREALLETLGVERQAVGVVGGRASTAGAVDGDPGPSEPDPDDAVVAPFDPDAPRPVGEDGWPQLSGPTARSSRSAGTGGGADGPRGAGAGGPAARGPGGPGGAGGPAAGGRGAGADGGSGAGRGPGRSDAGPAGAGSSGAEGSDPPRTRPRVEPIAPTPAADDVVSRDDPSADDGSGHDALARLLGARVIEDRRTDG